MSWSEPLRVRESLGYWLLHEAVVWVRRSSCDSVTDSELLVGRLSLASRLPQYLCYLLDDLCMRSWLLSRQAYLMTAMLTGAKVLARYTVLSAIVCELIWKRLWHSNKVQKVEGRLQLVEITRTTGESLPRRINNFPLLSQLHPGAFPFWARAVSGNSPQLTPVKPSLPRGHPLLPVSSQHIM